MKYRIRQVTTYDYDGLVPFARHVVRQTPLSSPTQEVLSCSIDIDPDAAHRAEITDFFGNRAIFTTIEKPHRALRVQSDAVVDVRRATPAQTSDSPSVAEVRSLAGLLPRLDGRAPSHFLFSSRYARIDGEITAYARESIDDNQSAFAAGLALAERIKDEFVYDPEATDVSTPVEEAFALRRGVCQDFAHLMISGLRGIGLPAAYVSGYIRTSPPPGRPRLEGADATHAWVALWCGDHQGWIGFDPTNGIAVGEDHIEVAFGRDYDDVAPIGGVIVTSADHELNVSVDVVPFDEIPQNE